MNRRDIFKLFGAGTALPAVKSIERLSVADGDTIIIAFPGRLRHDDVDRIKELMEAKFPQQKIIVMSEGAELKVLRKS